MSRSVLGFWDALGGGVLRWGLLFWLCFSFGSVDGAEEDVFVFDEESISLSNSVYLLGHFSETMDGEERALSKSLLVMFLSQVNQNQEGNVRFSVLDTSVFASGRAASRETLEKLYIDREMEGKVELAVVASAASVFGLSKKELADGPLLLAFDGEGKLLSKNSGKMNPWKIASMIAQVRQ